MTVRVRDARVYSRILHEGSVGLGESYADGWWDTDDLSGLLRLADRSLARTHTARDRIYRWLRPVVDPVARRRRADKDRDARNVRAHYDLGNEFFERILDETMMYSCAVFERPTDSLADASVHKLDRLANLLALAPGDRVLEIGTGWGGFAIHAATRYGCDVTTTTISQRQYEFAQRRVEDAGLEDRVTVLADDYRDLGGTFDKIIAIEMIEAVDWREYDMFFAHCRRLLDDAGALAMQAIVVRDESFDRIKLNTDFIKTAIFPGGCLPSVRALTAAANSDGFSHAHEDDIGLHYGETLRRWRRNLTDARDDLDELGLDERFVRSGSSTSPTARPRSKSVTFATCSCCTRRPRGGRRRFAPRRAPRPFITVGARAGADVTPKKDGGSREPDLTLQEAADLLGVHYMTAYRYVRTGRLPGTRVGAHWHVRHADLDKIAAAAPPGRKAATRRAPKKDYVRQLSRCWYGVTRPKRGDSSRPHWVPLTAPRTSTSTCSVPRCGASATTGQPAGSTSPTNTAPPS